MMMMMMMSALPAVYMPLCRLRRDHALLQGFVGVSFSSVLRLTVFLFRPTTLRYIRLGFLKAIPQVTFGLAYSNYGPIIYPVNSLGCLLSFCSSRLPFKNQRAITYLFILVFQDIYDAY